MENQKIIEQFRTQKDKLQSIKTLSEFLIWTRFVIDLTTKFAPHLTSAIEGLNYLLQVPTSIRSTLYPNEPVNNEHLVPDRKIKANDYLNQIIEHLKQNTMKDDKKSFWDNFDVKWLFGITLTLLAAVIALLAVVGNLMSSGLPNEYNRGYNTAKDFYINSKQRDIDLLHNKIDSLERKIQVLRDSISALK